MKRFLIVFLVASAATAVFLLGRSSDTPLGEPSEQERASNSETSSKDCSGISIIPLTEGPYYKTGSPQRQNLLDGDTTGTHLILKGYVLDTDCKPVANSWLDFWQANGEGNYDNTGYNLRGHQYTDENGFFRIETVVPGQYPGRTEHIHFKVRKSENSSVITSQLFFPESSTNLGDTIFDQSLVVEFGTDPDGSKYASYSIIVP